MKWTNITKAFITIIGCFFCVEVAGQVPDKATQDANCEQVVNLINELQEKNFSDTLLILKEAKNLSICLLKSNDYSSSIKGAEKLLKVVETRFKGSFFIEYVHILLNLGKFFQTNEQYSTNIYEKAFFEINKIAPINQQNNTLKACYMIIGNFFASKSWRDGTGKSNYTEKAEKCYRECLLIEEVAHGKMSSEYIQVLHTISKNYSRSFNLKKAESYCLESLELATKLYVGKDEAKLIDIWMNLADIYIRLSNFDAAETYYSKVQTTLEKNLEVNYSTYTNLLVNMGDMFYQKNNHEKAEKYYYNALKIQEEYSPKDSLKYVNIAYKLAEALFVLSKYEKAEWYYRKIIELREKIFGTEYATIGISPLQRIAEIKDKQAKYTERDESLRKLFKQGYENFVNKRTWVNLGSLDVLFWMDRDFIGPITLGTLSNNQSFSDYLYDYALITKGSSYYDVSSIFENLRSAHDDSMMIKRITNYKEKLKKIEQLASIPKIRRQYSYNDLLTEIQKEEIDLRKESAFFDKCVRKYTVTWDELKNQLSLREAAIEFIQLKNRYSALILKSNESKPIWVDLCSVQQLDSLMIRKSINDYQEINRIYNDIRLHGLLWQPLEKYLTSIDHVFFSTTKNLNEIAFRAIKVPNGKFLGSYIKLTQLSSTYELLEKSQKISIIDNNELALFGGIDYDAEATYLIQDKKNQFFNDSTINFTTLRDFRVDKFGKLPFTLIEVDSIKKIMGETGTLLTGAEASENQFKMLSRARSKSPKIIHIATHGFYFPKTANKNFDFKSMTFNKNFTPDSSKRLKITDIESGIALSGVNLSLQRLGPKNQLEDGILTPREVEKLNLINTELVVLSACETAKSYQSILGNASGFQKAFKKAGVKNILLSLWKVDDFSTQKMMKIFYKSLKSGSTVEEGYHNMVNEMKVLYPNDPYRWASFVLLQ